MSDAMYCPNCGYPISQQEVNKPTDHSTRINTKPKSNSNKASKWLLAIIILLIVILALLGIGGYWLANSSNKTTAPVTKITKKIMVTKNKPGTTNKNPDDASKDPVPIGEFNAISLLQKAGYNQLDDPEMVNNNKQMTTINSYKKDGDDWIKNTYTLYPDGKKVEIHLQSYKGSDKDDPGSFQDKIAATGPSPVTIHR